MHQGLDAKRQAYSENANPTYTSYTKTRKLKINIF